MEIFDSPYYNINKFLLKTLGLWPYLSKFRKNVSLLIFTIIAFSLIIPVLAGLVRAWGKNTVMVIEDCIGSLYFLSIYSKYVSVYVFENRMVLVYKQTAIDWKELSDKRELDILHKHARQGRILTIIYVSYGAFAVTIFNSMPYMPLILDLIAPKNESYDRIYPYYPYYYFIDEIKYHYTIFTCHGTFVIFIVTLAATAIDTMFVANVKHSCGLFDIVCYRLENIGRIKNNDQYHELVNDREVYKHMSSIFISHRASIESVRMIQQSFSISFLIIMGAAVVGVAMLMFDVLYNLDAPMQVLRIGVMLLGIYLSLFYLNWTAQQIVDNSEQVFRSIYKGYWYNISTNARKLTSVIMMRSITPCKLSAGGIFDMNLQSFASIVKTSASYATVMLSMQSADEDKK